MAVNPVLFMLPAMLAAAEQKRLAPFRAAGATSPDRAIPLTVDESARDGHLRSLLRLGIIVEASPGRYYLDERALARRRTSGHPVLAAVILGLGIIGFVAALVLLGD